MALQERKASFVRYNGVLIPEDCENIIKRMQAMQTRRIHLDTYGKEANALTRFQRFAIHLTGNPYPTTNDNFVNIHRTCSLLRK